MNRKNPIVICCALLASVAFTGVARAQWTTVLDTLQPIANAAVVETESRPALPQITSAQPHNVARSSDGLFYIHASVNGRRMRFLVDTGASVMVLTAADARSLGIALEDKHYSGSVETVGGATRMAWTTLERIDLAGHEIRNLRAAVVAEGLGVSLLGQNILSRLTSITITADQLSIR